MTDQSELKLIVEAIRDDNKDLKDGMREMSDSIRQMAVTMAEHAKNNQHLGERMDKMEDREAGKETRLQRVERQQEGNKVRWQWFAASISVVVTVSISLAMLWLRPIIEESSKGADNQEAIIKLLKDIRDEN